MISVLEGSKAMISVRLGSVKTEKYVSGDIDSAPITYFRYLNTICALKRKHLSAFRVVGLVDLLTQPEAGMIASEMPLALPP